MWRKQHAEKPERRPTDEALFEVLRLNDDHLRGLTRLDQELVYVPLTGLAAALFAVLSAARAPHVSDDLSAIGVGLGLALVPGVVVWGLTRNHRRHGQLLDYRDGLLHELGFEEVPERDDLKQGRLIYFALFAIAWTIGQSVLLSLLTR